MRCNSRKKRTESGRLRRKVSQRRAAHDTVWMHTQEVVARGRQVGCLDQFYGKVAAEVLPGGQLPKPGKATTAAMRLLEVVDVPGDVGKREPVEAREKERVEDEADEGNCEHLHEKQCGDEDGKCLQASLQGDL